MKHRRRMSDRQRWSLAIGLLLILIFILCCIAYALVRYAAGA